MNAVELGQSVKHKRQSERLSLMKLGGLIGVTQSTLSRIERGVGIPESTTLAKLSDWLCVPLDEMAGVRTTDAVIYNPFASTPEIVAAHLRVDPSLTPDKAALLIELFRASYAVMAGK